jgi:hypothetical protein
MQSTKCLALFFHDVATFAGLIRNGHRITSGSTKQRATTAQTSSDRTSSLPVVNKRSVFSTPDGTSRHPVSGSSRKAPSAKSDLPAASVAVTNLGSRDPGDGSSMNIFRTLFQYRHQIQSSTREWRDFVDVCPEPPSSFALRATEDREGGTAKRELGLRYCGAKGRRW